VGAFVHHIIKQRTGHQLLLMTRSKSKYLEVTQMPEPNPIVTQPQLLLPPPGPAIIQEMKRVWRHNWRALQKKQAATLTIGEWLDALNRHGWRCAHCGGPFESMDHVRSLRRGGGTVATNVVPSCLRCNSLRDQVETAIEVVVVNRHSFVVKDLYAELVIK